MEFISVKEMRVLELNSYMFNISTRLLMESAGASIANVLISKFGNKLRNMEVKVVIGKGGKAGDALAVARHLSSFTKSVKVITLFDNLGHKDSQENLKSITSMRTVKIMKFTSDISFDSDIIIDGLLGIGIKGPVKEPIKTAIELINKAKGYKVSIDVPSGVEPDTGKVLGVAVKANLTITLHKAKPGLVKAKDYVGELIVVSIGIPLDAEKCVGPGDVIYRVKQKPLTAKKGDGGRILVVAGSKDFVGAPWLTALAAWSAGADIVWLAAPSQVFRTNFSPEIIPITLEGPYISPAHISNLKNLIEKAQVIVVGPGLSLRNPELSEAVLAIVKLSRKYEKPLIIDADALKVIKELHGKHKEFRFKGKAVLTPHLGEASNLLGAEVKDSVDERIRIALEISRRFQVIAVLKGYVDVIAEPQGTYKLRYGLGHPDMSRGGTGDVLSGLIAGLTPRTDTLYEAALAATFINSLAGELSYLNFGIASPMKIIEFIPKIIKDPVKHFDELVKLRTNSQYR